MYKDITIFKDKFRHKENIFIISTWLGTFLPGQEGRRLLVLVYSSGFRVPGSGFRVQGSGFRVQGSGFRVPGSLVS